MGQVGTCEGVFVWLTLETCDGERPIDGYGLSLLLSFARVYALRHLGACNLFGLACLCERYVGILANRQKPLFPRAFCI